MPIQQVPPTPRAQWGWGYVILLPIAKARDWIEEPAALICRSSPTCQSQKNSCRQGRHCPGRGPAMEATVLLGQEGLPGAILCLCLFLPGPS